MTAKTDDRYFKWWTHEIRTAFPLTPTPEAFVAKWRAGGYLGNAWAHALFLLRPDEFDEDVTA